jgi:hypothetical protein
MGKAPLGSAEIGSGAPFGRRRVEARLIQSVIVRHASYGLELVDALTGGPLLGRSAVVLASGDVEPFLANASRWVFEDLPAGAATFSIEADLYVPRQLTTGTLALPYSVPPATSPGALVRVLMMPRTGYPFPPTLTRVVGQVRLDPSVDPASPPVAGAEVAITPRHNDGTTTVDDPDITVYTTEDGQYTLWFVADPDRNPPIANELVATASAGGYGGSLSTQTLIPNKVTSADPIFLS